MFGQKFFPYSTLQELNLDWILTKVKNILRFVPDDGAVGQILRRTRDGAEWSNETGGGGAVDSVNGQTGTVVLTASDVGALPDSYTAPVTSVNTKTGAVVLDKTDIGLGNVANVAQYSASNPPPYPVTSVNGQTGDVVLDASDVGALPDNTVIPTKTSDLNNDSGFITSAQAPVQSVNGQTGAVVTTGKSTYTPTVVKTSGNSSFYSGAAVECSGACTLSLTFTNGNDTSAGGNSFVGNVSGVPLPYSESVGIGYYGTHVFGFAVRPDGSFTVRVLIGGGYWSASDRHTVSVTYIVA